MNYSDLRPIDSANGLGVSTTLFVSGCNFHCLGCFNKEAQDFNYGKPFTKEVEDNFIKYAQNKHVNHVSLLGGEVFHQDLNIIYNLIKRIKADVNKPIWIWTGFIFEELIKNDKAYEILKMIDVLVDGQFIQKLYDYNLLFRGSSNQRIIDIQKSLKSQEVVLWQK